MEELQVSLELVTDCESLLDTVPYVRYGSRPGDPAWSAAFPQLISEVWKRNGDLSVIAKHYDGLIQYIDLLIQAANKTGLSKLFAYYGLVG